MTQTHPQVVPCTGVPITACTRDEAARLTIDLAVADKAAGAGIHLCNAYTLALADKNPRYHEMLCDATVNFPDGMSVVWANRWNHKGMSLPKERVYGPDLFLDVFDQGRAAGLKHYLLGSTPEVIADLTTALELRFPDVNIVGAESPPFREQTMDEEASQLERLNSSGANIVWVGLGTPKQDWAVAQFTQKLPLTFVAVGAAFDFVAGHKSQAPEWMQNHGLEWAFRFASEPRRLWKRYAFGNVRFLLATLRG